jgi:ketosteroid isomerase-like protein
MVTQPQAQDLLEAYKRALERLDVDLAVSLYSEDADLRDDPFEQSCAGLLEIRARWNSVAATRTNVELDIERSWIVGDTILASWHSAHTVRRTAERYRQRGFLTFELDADGLITRERRWVLERTVGLDATWAPEPDGT